MTAALGGHVNRLNRLLRPRWRDPLIFDVFLVPATPMISGDNLRLLRSHEATPGCHELSVSSLYPPGLRSRPMSISRCAATSSFTPVSRTASSRVRNCGPERPTRRRRRRQCPGVFTSSVFLMARSKVPPFRLVCGRPSTLTQRQASSRHRGSVSWNYRRTEIGKRPPHWRYSANSC